MNNKKFSIILIFSLFILIIFGLFFHWNNDKTILITIRIPEVLTAILVGFSLGFSGAISQIIFKNPLADPYILGISSGATFGISLTFLLGIYTIWGLNSIFLFSIIFGIISIFTIFTIYKLLNRRNSILLLLIGVVYGFFMNSFTTLILSNINGNTIYSIFEWLFGTVYFYNIKILIIFTLFIIIFIAFTLGKSNVLDKMYFSDKKAVSLGINIHKERFYFFIIIAILISISVAISGIIGFLGLMSPHITRKLFGNRAKILTFYSGINGSIILLFSYIISKNLNNLNMPVGILTSLVGAIYFIFLLVKHGGFDI